MRKLCTALALAILTVCFSLPAYAFGYAFTAEMPETVNSGRSFDISIKYNGEKLLGGIWFEVEYDSDYFSFKSFSADNCVFDYDNSGGKLSLICIFNDINNKTGEMTMTFTSKTGVPSAEKSFYFKCVQAVTSDLKNTDISITPSLDISVVRKSDGTDKDESPSQRENKSTSKNTNASKSKDSKTSSSKEKKASSGKNSNTKASSAISSEENIFVGSASSLSEHEYGDEVSSSLNQTVRLYENESKSALVIAGAVGASAVVGILFGLYKLGKIEKKQ